MGGGVFVLGDWMLVVMGDVDFFFGLSGSFVVIYVFVDLGVYEFGEMSVLVDVDFYVVGVWLCIDDVIGEFEFMLIVILVVIDGIDDLVICIIINIWMCFIFMLWKCVIV